MMEKNNNLKNLDFLFKLCFKAAPGYIISLFVFSCFARCVVFLEHVYSIKYVLEVAEFNKPFNLAINIMVIVLLLLIAKLFIGAIFDNYYTLYLLPKVNMQVKLKIYSHAKDMDIKNYDDPNYYNDFSLSVNEVEKSIERLINTIKNLTEGITGVICCGMLYVFNDKLSMLFIVISFIGCFTIDLITTKINFKIAISRNHHERKREYCKRIFYMNEYAKEVRMIPQVREIFGQKFIESNEEIYNIEKKYVNVKFWMEFIKNYIFCGICLNIWYIVYLLYKVIVVNSITVSTMAILYDSGKQFRDGLNVISTTITELSENSLYIGKIKEFLGKEPTIVSSENIAVPSENVSLEFRNVYFRYNDDSPYIIRDVSFKVNVGERIAIVGDNGAGKTTLVKLMLRLYDPTSGEILLNGINIKKYNVDEYRKSAGIVFQDFQVYAASLYENVSMCKDKGNNGKQKENAMSLLTKLGFKKAQCLVHGIDTSVTTEFDRMGINFSGGEKQKIATARALYGPHNFYVLDEPSSALDPISEDILNTTMKNLTRNKTALFISHRLAMAKDVDKIIVMNRGEIIETGTHDQLIKSRGKYAKMWDAQSKRYNISVYM